MNAAKLIHRFNAIVIGISMGALFLIISNGYNYVFDLIYSMVLGGYVCYYIMRMQNQAYFQSDKVDIKLEKVKGQWER